MLIEFRVANFRSFNEEQTLSLVASKDASHKDNLIALDKFNLLKVEAIYGANASGKSNLIKALQFVELFIRNSATTMNQGDEIPYLVPFRLSSQTIKQPSRFFIKFFSDGDIYEYEFSATVQRVYSEKLAECSHGRRHVLLERNYDPATDRVNWEWESDGLPPEERTILSERTRDNGLALSRGAELNIKLLAKVFAWFRKSLWIHDLTVLPAGLVGQTAQAITKDDALRQDLMRLIQHADLGIDAITTKEVDLREVFAKQLEELKEALAPKFFDKFLAWGQKTKPLKIESRHRIENSDKFVEFDFQEDESNGTNRFFGLAGALLMALRKNQTLIVDEMECSMHPLLTHKLIDFFQSPNVGAGRGQLIFATHDVSLMDPTLFRRDQLWITEKDSAGASILFSLYDIDTKPRITEAFQRNYLSGRYGGVPKFGPTLENARL